MQANWSYPTAIHFGVGRILELADSAKAVGMARPLFVTDGGLASLPMTQSALACLTGAGLFSEVQSNPTDDNLAAGIEAFRAGDHDGVVAFGGGSALDLGKLIAFMAGQTRPVWDFEDVGDWWTRANADAIAPIIAVPTTAGTGSEVGRAGVLTDTANHVKKVIFHPKMLPVSVICDPALTIGMSPAMTAGTGMDAFAHCLEAFCAPGYHPMSEGIALEGMRQVSLYLHRAFDTPDNLEARGGMMSAAAMGAVAFQKGLGGIHALSHPIGAMYDTHHGMTNAVVMPAVLAVNRPAIEERIERLSAFLGIDGGFDGFFSWVLDLRAALNVPASLDAFGVPRDGFQRIADMVPDDPTAGGNPIAMTADIIEAMLNRAFDGDV